MLEKHTIYDNVTAGAKKSAGHRVSDIREAVRDKNRVNVYIDDKFFCSLDIAQVVDLHVKIGRELNNEELEELKRASDFSKFYNRALEFTLMRPHSSKEVRDYLKRKTLDRKVRVKNQKTGEYKTVLKQGYDQSLVEPVYKRLEERGYINDRRFAETWVENRNITKGSSLKKLRLELAQKGISQSIVEEVLAETDRDDAAELRKIIARKAKKYPDEQKLIQYLMRQGFNYSDILDELSAGSSL